MCLEFGLISSTSERCGKQNQKLLVHLKGMDQQ